MTVENFSLLNDEAPVVARRLLGSLIIREFKTGEKIIAKIVETEAYNQTDAASHSYKGKTPRTEVMFGPFGHAYVYFTYGMHYCFNVTTGPEGSGAAVLIRAVEIIEGLETAQQNRPMPGILLTNGPAKLCQALAIDKSFNGHSLREAPLRLELLPPENDTHITQTTRIGIRHDADRPWRFYLKNSPWVSKQ